LGLVWCFDGVDRRLVLWVDFGVLAVAKFQFHGGCWRRWVCCGGVVAMLGLLWWCCGNAGFVVVVLWLFATIISNKL